jgi:hypothetical protein
MQLNGNIKPKKRLTKTAIFVIALLVIFIISLTQIKNIKLLILYYSPVHSIINPWISTSTDSQIKKAFSHLDGKGDINLKDEKDYLKAKRDYTKESVEFKQNDLSVIRFYYGDRRDTMFGGGCMLSGDSYYYKINDKYYPADLNNTYQLRKPKNANDWLEVIRIDEYFHPGFCGHESILTTSQYLFYPKDYKSFGCEPIVKDVKARLETIDNNSEFVYYRYSIEAPAGLSEMRESLVNGELEENPTVVYECLEGIQY